jgi:hypothetical protein
MAWQVFSAKYSKSLQQLFPARKAAKAIFCRRGGKGKVNRCINYRPETVFTALLLLRFLRRISLFAKR